MTSPRIGLALGGGGARGLAHIPVLEALDDLGIVPAAIAGTSIGAIMAAGYGAGMTGADIRTFTTELFNNRTEVLSRLWKLRGKGLSMFENGGLARIDAERVVELFLPENLPENIEDLRMPVSLVAADFYGWDEADLRTGPLRKSIAASIALPVIFKPVSCHGRVMMDGGLVNPLPFDKLPEDVDIVLAVDVLGGPEPHHRRKLPSTSESIFGATQLLMQTIQREKLSRRRPDILIRPDINAFRVLNFLKANEILKAAGPVREETKRRLGRLIHVWETGGDLAAEQADALEWTSAERAPAQLLQFER
ncbi:MAG: patatin [Hyphomicrobiales bacterium]|nr:MAG: patatin [Hyphomicrobiales bacterium]